MPQPRYAGASHSPFEVTARRRCSSVPWPLVLPALATALLTVATTIAVTALLVRRGPVALHPECLYLLGGGRPYPGGSFPEVTLARAAAACRPALLDYLAGQYYRDVDIAVASARAYFGNLTTAANASQLVVFDVDETLLSNMEGLERQVKQGFNSTWNRQFQLDARAPALAAMHELYAELYHAGYSLALITGRDEHGGLREATAQNLERAGYGQACPPANLTSGPATAASARGGESSREADSGGSSGAGQLPGSARRQLRATGFRLGGAGNSGLAGRATAAGPSAGAPAGGRPEQPCYLQLDMRSGAQDLATIASVYKPARRQALQAGGYELVASFGDQWSDLAGQAAAAASFKLPNPVYYIL